MVRAMRPFVRGKLGGWGVRVSEVEVELSWMDGLDVAGFGWFWGVLGRMGEMW